jgi:ribosome modulation factor
MWIDKIQNERWTDEYIHARAAVCAQVVASKGDVILYRSKKRGETAEAFNALAEGIALLSFAPGGVHAFGLDFETVREGAMRSGTTTPLRRAVSNVEKDAAGTDAAGTPGPEDVLSKADRRALDFKSPQLRGAYWRGYRAGESGQSQASCPYADVLSSRGHVTFSRAYINAWTEGWKYGAARRAQL